MRPWNILVVDDEPLNLEIICDVLDDSRYVVTTAVNGEEGWQMLLAAPVPPDVIVLDRMMPVLNGIELLKRIKADSRFVDIPVVIQTAASSPAEVTEGIALGAWYYLTKPYAPRDLLGVIRSALEEVEERVSTAEAVSHPDLTIALLDAAEFSFSTLAQAHHLAGVLAGLCPDPGSAAMGLLELLINAVEHGNLGISYADKARMRRDDTWDAEIVARLADPVLGAKRARVVCRRLPDSVSFVISDEGEGFEWQRYLDFDPERAFDPNGRGIAMARHTCFTCIEYQGCGNVVTATVQR
jgi:CheY-like chemotaxis protein